MIMRQRYVRKNILWIVVTVSLLVLVASTFAWTNYAATRGGLLNRLLSAIVFYASLTPFLGWLLYCTRGLFKSKFTKVVMFAVLFVWGCSSYFCWPVDRVAGESANDGIALKLESMNRLFACCFSGSSFEQVPVDGSRLNYELFHCALVFFLGGWAFSFWGAGFVNILRRCWTRDCNLSVIWGVSEQGLYLARDIVSTDAVRQVEFNVPQEMFEKDEEGEFIRQLDDLDCFWSAVDFAHVMPRHLKGCEHYFLSASSEENVRLADALIGLLPEKPVGEMKTFHVRIDSSMDEESFYEWADSVKEKVDVAIVRESELIARRFVRDYSVLESCPGITVGKNGRVAGEMRLLLVGLGAIGWDILERMIGESRFSRADGKEMPFSCLVVDNDRKAWDDFCSYCPEAVQAYNLSFEERDVESPFFPSWLAQRLSTFNRVVLALPRDDTNVSTLMRLRRAAIEQGVVRQKEWLTSPEFPRVFVKVLSPERHALLERVRNSRHGDVFLSRVRYYGDLKTAYSRRSLDFDTLYEIASVLNAYYETQDWLDWATHREEIVRRWRQATWNSRWSSLASAAGEWNALRLLGFSADRSSGGGEGDVDKCKQALVENLDTLARNEHFRWNAWHRMRGYRRWDLEDPPIEGEAKKKANKLEDFRRHAAIVDYDDLPAVDLRLARAIDAEGAARLSPNVFANDGVYGLGGNRYPCNQKKDRDFCRTIADNVIRAGFTLVQKDI